MGFESFHASLTEICRKHPTARSAVFLRLLAMPSLTTIVRNHYTTLGPLRKPCRRYVEQLTEVFVREKPDEEYRGADGDLGKYVKHLLASVKLHAHASDPDVRRWAQICADLDEDDGLRATVCDFFDRLDDARVANVVRGSLDWTVSECIRRGAPVMPHGAR